MRTSATGECREVSALELLLSHLPACVGSPLSVNSLGRLLQVSHESVERWLGVFERLYLCYRIPPFGAGRIRAVRKEKKLYFWDWARIEDRGARFENMVAGHLLKYCHYVEDTEGHDMELRGTPREVDFVVLRDGVAEFAVECKSGDSRLPSGSGRISRGSIRCTSAPGLWQRRRQHARYASTFCREVLP